MYQVIRSCIATNELLTIIEAVIARVVEREISEQGRSVRKQTMILVQNNHTHRYFRTSANQKLS
jgi:hypothetical protein